MIMSMRGLVAAANTIRAGFITFFLVKTLGQRSQFVDEVTGKIVRIAVWDGAEFFLSSQEIK